MAPVRLLPYEEDNDGGEMDWWAAPGKHKRMGRRCFGRELDQKSGNARMKRAGQTVDAD